jgi:hypothetical protein
MVATNDNSTPVMANPPFTGVFIVWSSGRDRAMTGVAVGHDLDHGIADSRE